jgi:hypothetical protein
MHEPLNATHSKRAWSSCLTELALPFLGMNVMYSSPKMRVVWYMGHTCDYIWKEICVFFKPQLCVYVSSAPYLGGAAQTWQEPNTCANCPLYYSDQIQMKFPTCKHLHGYCFFCFWRQITSQISHFCPFCLSSNGHPNCSSSTEIMLLLDLENHSKTLSFPLSALRKLLSTF